jgi:hypothetical protein
MFVLDRGLMATTDTPEHPHWTIKGAANRNHVHPLTIRRAIRAGKIQVLRFSSQCVRIPHAELMRYEQEARA